MAENSPAFQRRDHVVRILSPEGTAEPDCLSRPFGTHSSPTSNPALKRRAILNPSLRAGKSRPALPHFLSSSSSPSPLEPFFLDSFSSWPAPASESLVSDP